MDLKKIKATADRLLAKVAKPATITVKSDILGVADQTANVFARLLTASHGPEQPAAIQCLISATPFPIRGGQLTQNGVTYDIVEVMENGVGADQFAQKAVLHER